MGKEQWIIANDHQLESSPALYSIRRPYRVLGYLRRYVLLSLFPASEQEGQEKMNRVNRYGGTCEERVRIN